MFTQLETW